MIDALSLFSPGCEFTFITDEGGQPSTAWRYQFESAGDGRTRVTESHEVRWIPTWARIPDVVQNRQKELLEGMRTTLERLKAASERAQDSTPHRASSTRRHPSNAEGWACTQPMRATGCPTIPANWDSGAYPPYSPNGDRHTPSVLRAGPDNHACGGWSIRGDRRGVVSGCLAAKSWGLTEEARVQSRR